MIIVTGGAGFIGSNLVRGLNQKGIEDIMIVDNTKGNKSKIKNLNSLKFSEYSDKNDFLNQLPLLKEKDIQAIFHLGACSNTMETNKKYLMENNYLYSKKLLNFCLENKIQFIYASSASVYGNGDFGFEEKGSCENPLNNYALSKFLFDKDVRKLTNLPSQVVGIRYFNVYGPQENHKEKMASAVYHFHNQILSEGKIKLFEGSENFLRDFIYVDDAVKTNLFFFEHPEINGIFNCGTGKEESFLKMGEIMTKLYNQDIKMEFTPFPENLSGKYQKFTKADLTNLRKIGFDKDFTSLEEGIKKYVSILQNKNGFY
ncbi:ADP-L-glycero-D-manno-heptose-6-epimerase [uncultured archaeon]|nr:ADP-L-glycero-D-manno-heptose-6-epimerase [uncultured archaeon]